LFRTLIVTLPFGTALRNGSTLNSESFRMSFVGRAVTIALERSLTATVFGRATVFDCALTRGAADTSAATSARGPRACSSLPQPVAATAAHNPNMPATPSRAGRSTCAIARRYARCAGGLWI
jgi:hypothetical protein